MSDYRFGDDYKLSIYPKEAMGYDGLDMDKVESVEIEWVDFVRKPDGKSRWHELFGTPERAAGTLIDICDNCGQNECSGCQVYELTSGGDLGYDTLLGWLRGDAE